MTPLEKKLLEETCDGREPRLLMRTRTRIDAGRWWRRTPVWLCIVDDELILLAVARRRHVERVALADCRGSYYGHATGELMIKPAESLQLKRLKLSPREALTVLSTLEACPGSNLQATS